MSFDGGADAMRAVELDIDGIDANLQDLPVWTFYATGFPQLTAIGDPVGRGYYVAMLRKGEPELLQAVNEAILEGAPRWTASADLFQVRDVEQDAAATRTGDQSRWELHRGRERESRWTASEESPTRSHGWTIVAQRGWLLVQSAGMTVMLSGTAMPLAVLIGLLLALVPPLWTLVLGRRLGVRRNHSRHAAGAAAVRDLLSAAGDRHRVTAFWAAIAGLAINYSAYEAEIYRAGLQAIPRGQMEAALSLGMSRWLAIRRIIMPQAMRLVIPPVTNDFIALFKDTAVCSVITVVELSKQYYLHANSTGAVVELGIVTAVLYLVMSYPLSILAGWLERRLHAEHRP